MLLAVEYMMDLCDAEPAYSNKYACLIRGEHWTIVNDKPIIMDTVIARVVDKQKVFDYYLLAYADDHGQSRRRLWEQRYRLDGITYQRTGDGSRNDWLKHQLPNVPGFSKKFAFSGPVVDPFQSVIAPLGSWAAREVDENFSQTTFLANARFLGGRLDERGRIVGGWEIFGQYGSCAEITFENEEPHRPSQVVWRKKNGPLDPKTWRSLGVFCVNSIEWAKGPGDFIVPVKLTLTEYESGSGMPVNELMLEYQWKIGSDVRIDPPQREQLLNFVRKPYDWRQPIYELFSDNLVASYPEWKKHKAGSKSLAP